MGHSFGLGTDGNGYQVEQTRHGILVFGSVPVTDMLALIKAWKKDRGYKTAALGVATAMQAVFAATKDEKTAKAWCAEIDARAEAVYGAGSELAWLHGTDTGSSSLTIFSVLSNAVGGMAPAMERGTIHGVTFSPSIPRDPDDFGRCSRLLARFPAWRARLGEVAAKYPDWAPLVAEWEALEEMLLDGEGRCPMLYDRLQVLTKKDGV